MKKLVEEDIVNLRKKTDTPAISLTVVRDEKIFQQVSNGKTLITNSVDDVNHNTIFEAASLSKPLFAYLVLKLVEDGIIKLDASLADINLPEIQFDKSLLSSKEDAEKFTVRSILSHQSGLEVDRDGKFKFLFKPGEQYRYSGAGFLFLQKIIEHETKKTLEQLAKEYVFDHIHMNNSSFIRPESFKEMKIAVGHTFDNQPIPKNADYLQKESQGVSANSLQSTAYDFALFVNAWMGESKNSKILQAAFDSAISMEKDAWAHAAEVSTKNLHKLSWGLGWGLLKTDQGKTIAFHWGDMGESKGFVAMNLTDKTGIVYLTNSFNGLSIAHDLVSATLGQECSPIFDFLFKKYGFEDYKTHDWKIKQALGTWHNWQKYEMYDKESFIANSVANNHLKVHADPESNTLTIEYDPTKTGIIAKVIKNELKLFKYNHNLNNEDCKFEENADKTPAQGDNKNKFVTLTINIPDSKLYNQFIETLNQEKLLPEKYELKPDQSIHSDNEELKSIFKTPTLKPRG